MVIVEQVAAAGAGVTAGQPVDTLLALVEKLLYAAYHELNRRAARRMDQTGEWCIKRQPWR